ncbi:MAG: formylglycine-generating enzyme family protein [Planctomycetes bacterium]|jgi:iron(II)-dependent oxidoreductase|nr:formylglycine-generating enzyme family protein [Planctomycetota bacterium]
MRSVGSRFLAVAALLAAAVSGAPALGGEEAALPVPAGLRPGDAPGEYVWGADEAVMVAVPGGLFPRGADASEPDEGPAGTVAVSGFYLDRAEVDNRRFRKFHEAWRAAPPEVRARWTHPEAPAGFDPRPAFWPEDPKDGGKNGATKDSGDASLAGDDQPVVGVSWFGAWAYARWAGKDLPTEAEWEKAASYDPARRAKRLYPWGNEAPDFTRANVLGNVGKPVRPGNYPGGAAACGALDLAGNVWEWCLDYYHKDFYGTEAGKAPDPVNRFPSAHRSLRGGSYRSSAEEARTSFRDRADPARAFRDVGFRCVLHPGAGERK